MNGSAVNPYIAGAPLRGEQGFFGRQDTLEWVAHELRNSQANALVLFGQRRIGKTTLLLQLARNLPQDEFLPVYFDLQDQATRPLGKTLADLADILCEKANMDVGELGSFDDRGHTFQKEFLPRLYAALGEKRRPVFLLDEFDVLDQTAEAELAETATAKALFPLLRRLIMSDDRSAFVFVVGRRAEDLSIDFNATFKSSLVQEVWVLDEKSSEALVRQAQANGTLEFTEDAIQRILSLTNHHPYLTQLLCQRIWELAYATDSSARAKVDVAQVDLALESSLETGNQALEWLWSGLNPAEKIYASALAEIAGENETIPEERIIEVLATHAARLRTREIELAPRDLVKRHVLDVSGERNYRFAVELFRRWVHKNKPLTVVKDEVDRVDPMADRLFVFGNGFFDARQWERAVFYFREALNVNARHFRARLYLGETLLEQGKVDEAIAELNHAFVLDRDETRLPLARAWLAKAELLKADGNVDLLLQAYDKVLELSPRESQAIQGRAAIWLQRGQEAEERGDLITARDAYRQAGDRQNIERLESLEREQLLKDLQEKAGQQMKAERWEAAMVAYAQLIEFVAEDASPQIQSAELAHIRTRAQEQWEKARDQAITRSKVQAQSNEQNGEWEKAIETYQKLIELDTEGNWRGSLSRARHEQELVTSFKQGRAAQLREDWKEAQRLFAQLIQERPDFAYAGLLAVDLLQDSLQHTPGQFRTHLLLGEIFLGMGRLDDGIRQLEAAYALDHNEAHPLLVRGLMALAKEKEKAGLDQEALNAVERVLAIVPQERSAQDARKSILDRLGDQALRRGDLTGALSTFKKAGIAEKIQQVEGEVKKRELQRLEQDAETLEKRMEWKQAIALYEQLIEKAPDPNSKGTWESRLEHCREEEKLESLFTLGLGSLTRGNWDQAKKTFSELVYIRPDYAKDGKPAVRLLEQAVTGRKSSGAGTILESSLFRIVGSVALLAVIGFSVWTARNAGLGTVLQPTLTPTVPSATLETLATATLQPTALPTTSIAAPILTSMHTPDQFPTITRTPVQSPTATATLPPLSMQSRVTSQGHIFSVQNVPAGCQPGVCEVKWMAWEGDWLDGKPTNGPDIKSFQKLRYDSGWKPFSADNLKLTYALPAVSPGKPYLVTFQLCVNTEKTDCKTASGIIQN